MFVHRPSWSVQASVSPPEMVAPYYDKFGFRSEGDRWVLDVA